MRKIIFLITVCALFASCQKPTQIQIVNERWEEKTSNYGLVDYYGDTGRIRDVEFIYIEYGEMCDVWIIGYRYVSADDGAGYYDLVDDIMIRSVKANSVSDVIELENCSKVEVRYIYYAYDNYYLNSVKIATIKYELKKTEDFDNIKSGKINKLTIKD